MVWLVAGLIGAGVAWLSTGLAGAGLAFATNHGSRPGGRPIARRPAAPTPAAQARGAPPQKPAAGPFDALLNSPPSDGPFASPPRQVPMPRLDSRQPGTRAMSWLESAREELRRSGLNGAPGFDQRRRR
jgi:hypothetical protein